MSVAVACPRHARPAHGRPRARPGHAGDRQGGVPLRAHRRRGPGGGPRYDGEAEVSETQGAGLTLAQLGELAAPSLFSSTRCVVVRGLENLPEESVDGLLAYAAAPADDVALVLVHGGGQKGTAC